MKSLSFVGFSMRLDIRSYADISDSIVRMSERKKLWALRGQCAKKITNCVVGENNNAILVKTIDIFTNTDNCHIIVLKLAVCDWRSDINITIEDFSNKFESIQLVSSLVSVQSYQSMIICSFVCVLE